jgi:CheY-like chemotaxis protein
MWLPSRTRTPPPKATRRPPPVLVVDDDDDIRTVLRQVLSEWGYSSICAANGYEAMRLVQNVTPSTIILDLWMPKMNGFLFRKWQLTQPYLAGVPVIVLTAAGAQGADQLDDVTALYKPVDFDLLQALLGVQSRAHR